MTSLLLFLQGYFFGFSISRLFPVLAVLLSQPTKAALPLPIASASAVTGLSPADPACCFATMMAEFPGGVFVVSLVISLNLHEWGEACSWLIHGWKV